MARGLSVTFSGREAVAQDHRAGALPFDPESGAEIAPATMPLLCGTEPNGAAGSG
jgi:hypothetical protein